MTGSNRPLLGTRSRVSSAKVGSASCLRLESAEVDIALNLGGGRRLEAGKAVRNLARRPGFSRYERSGDTYDGSEIRDSCRRETTPLCWVWRRVERSVAGRM